MLCETDFVARNDDMSSGAQKLAEELLANGEDAMQAMFQEILKDLVVKLGENIQLGQFAVLTGDQLGAYVHSTKKTGALVAFDGSLAPDLSKDIAMQVVASMPLYVEATEIPAHLIEKEKEIYLESMKEENKPEEIKEKIIAGKVQKWKDENTLLGQSFVKDPSKKIADLLGGSKVKAFMRVTI